MHRLAIAFFFISCAAAAQDSDPLPPALEPVPDGNPITPATPNTGKQAPQVTIIRQLDGVYEEHRINGRLYMIRVLPKKGIPYFLIDKDGDGNLETRYNNDSPDVLIPGWVIMNW